MRLGIPILVSALRVLADNNHIANTVNHITAKRSYRSADWAQRMTERPGGQNRVANVYGRGGGGYDEGKKEGAHHDHSKGGHAQDEGNAQSAGSGRWAGNGQVAGQHGDRQRAGESHGKGRQD